SKRMAWAWSPDGKRIAVVSWPDNNKASLSVVDIASKGVVNLGDVATTGGFPQWLPDDKGIILIATKDKTYHIFSVDIESKSQTDLAPELPEMVDLTLTVSPNGKHIVFGSYIGTDNSKPQTLYVLEAGGKNPVEVIASENARFILWDQGWSSDSSRLFFSPSSSAKKDRGLYVLDMDSKKATKIIDEKVISAFALSPDGKRMAIHSLKPSELYFVDTDGKNLVKVVASGVFPKPFMWSSDSQQFLFAPFDDKKAPSVHIADADGKNLVQINSVQPESSFIPWQWSADSKRILYTMKGQVYVMDADGQNVKPITDKAQVVQAVRWQPAEAK
ncbi:MAG: PD40 domain-containing protein, partial [Anaerolineae bacterium]|nr:PD40 domain-containing protein [Anaerolineae bacterium]